MGVVAVNDSGASAWPARDVVVKAIILKANSNLNLGPSLNDSAATYLKLRKDYITRVRDLENKRDLRTVGK